MEAEDLIKLGVRNDLRDLALDREQYVIAVAQAALAFERVVSTSLEFRLGTGGVSARDFLEAQTAYTDALSDVASQHIQYIVDRTQLFLDLELLVVNEQGFWNELYDESFQPEAYFQIPTWGAPVYGDLPSVWYSDDILQMLDVKAGPATIGQAAAGSEATSPAANPTSRESRETSDVPQPLPFENSATQPER